MRSGPLRRLRSVVEAVVFIAAVAAIWMAIPLPG